MRPSFANTVHRGMMPERRAADLRLLAWLVAVSALVAVATAGAMFAFEARTHRGRAVQGTVVGLPHDAPPRVLVEYAAPEGAPVRASLSELPKDRVLVLGDRLRLVAVPDARGEWVRLDRRPWNWIPAGAMLLLGVAEVAIYFIFRALGRRAAARLVELQRHGRRFAVRTASTARVAPKGPRWGIVAEWVDALGRTQGTVASGYDYDPAPLLAVDRMAVLNDGSDAARAVLDPATLPTALRSRLDPASRAAVDAATPVPLLQRLAVGIAVVATLALFAYGVVQTWRALT